MCLLLLLSPMCPVCASEESHPWYTKTLLVTKTSGWVMWLVSWDLSLLCGYAPLSLCSAVHRYLMPHILLRFAYNVFWQGYTYTGLHRESWAMMEAHHRHYENCKFGWQRKFHYVKKLKFSSVWNSASSYKCFTPGLLKVWLKHWQVNLLASNTNFNLTVPPQGWAGCSIISCPLYTKIPKELKSTGCSLDMTIYIHCLS